MTVLVDGCSVLSGTAGAIFDNDGGLLRLNNLQVNGVTSASLVATANNGASFLEKSTVTGKSLASQFFIIEVGCRSATSTHAFPALDTLASDLNTVTFTTAGGSQTVLASTVSSMNRIEDVFFVEDVGSTLLLDGVMVVENQVQTVPWNVVSARTKAIARVTETTISDNMAIEYGVVAFDASVTIMDSFISRNSGTVRN